MIPMERLTCVSGSFGARVLAARLYDEGIDAELRGAVNSPYGFTVGEMARVDVYVPLEQAEDARLVMLSIEVDAATDLPELHRGAPIARWPLWVVLVAVVVTAVAPIARYVSL